MILSNVKRRATIGLVLAPLATAAIALGSGEASAYPSHCGSQLMSNGASAWCNGGTGEIRAVAGCQNPFGWWSTPAKASWKNIKNGASWVACPWGYTVKWSGFDLR